MDALIRIPAIEFNETLFRQIADMIKGKNAEVIISVKDNAEQPLQKETNEEYWNRIDRSIDDLKTGKGIAFTMDEFIPSN